jgi:plasmid stabilization system protein ParE
VSWVVRLRPEAELDLLFAAGWYEAQRPGLGARFTQEMADLAAMLADNAMMYPEIFEGVRRALSHRFPYVVTYRIDVGEVLVLSVLHMRRNR